MTSLQKIFKTLVWPFFLVLLSSSFLFAEEKKTLPPARPEAQKECDQNEPKATSSDSSISSPMAPSKEKTGNLNPLPPPPLKIQESPDSGG